MRADATVSLLVCVTLQAALLAVPSKGFATIVMPFTPEKATARASFVFAGTVSNSRSERIDHTIVTKVAFKGLRFGKGSVRDDSLILTLEGGVIGNELVAVDGQPSFRVGKRYIVFALTDLGSPRNSYMPVLGLDQGYFIVEPGTADGAGQVLDFLGCPVVALARNQVTVLFADSMIPAALRPDIDSQRRRDSIMGGPPVRETRGPRRVIYEPDDPSTRVTEREFLEAVSEFSR